jgi:glycosyltransferase 2 family protein
LVSRLERGVFGAVNGLPQAVFPPVWLVMQLGSLGGVGTIAGAAATARHPTLGRRLGVWGSVTWAAAKLVKRFVRRGRPAGVLETVRTLGREQTGLGYPSGHAAVAATIATVATPYLRSGWRQAAWAAALAVGPARLFVGAHLPLDVVGGIGLGMGIGAVGRLVEEGR